jgi:uncharacterized membrane protein
MKWILAISAIFLTTDFALMEKLADHTQQLNQITNHHIQ